RCTTSQKRRIWIRWKRLPRYRPHDAIHHQACALLKIFDGLFRRGVEGAGDIAGREYLGHYKDPLKSSYVATSRADADCWTAVHNFTLSASARFSCRNFANRFSIQTKLSDDPQFCRIPS